MLEFILILIGTSLSIYLWLTRHYDHWQKLGIPYAEPKLGFGSTKEFVLGKKNIGVAYDKYYKQYQNEPAVGTFKLRQPQLMLRDIELVKTVLIKNFNSFHDNDLYIDKEVEPIFGLNPFSVKGEDWKAIRSLHTQKQTSGKIKQMFLIMNDVSSDMINYLDGMQGESIDGKYFCGQYTTDVVGACVYGLRTNSFVDPNAKFRKMASRLFQPGSMTNFLLVLFAMAPGLTSRLKLRIFPTDLVNFFVKVVKDSYNHRMANNVSQNDFLGALMEDNKKSSTPVHTFEEITGHTMVFFFDGYETTSTAMALALYLIAMHKDVQTKLREEINSFENLDYESIHGMQYLEAVLNETLRMYPPAGVLIRECNIESVLVSGKKKYPVKVGQTIIVPAYSIMNDPTHFPEPWKFKPERFYKQSPSPYFLPFGMGPRACIGKRFAQTQIKAGIAKLVKWYNIQTVLDNPKMPDIDPRSTVLIVPKDKLWIKFEKIQ